MRHIPPPRWVGIFVGVTASLLWHCKSYAQTPPGPTESDSPAYATSVAFDLRPKVARATLHLRRPDMRSMYQAIAEAYGIRLLFDSELGESRVASSLDLEDATLKEALEAAGEISNTFVAPLDEQTGIVAQDTAQKRGQYERQLLAYYRADERTTPQQLTEVVTALRTIVDLRRITQDTQHRAITVRGFSRQISVADRFLRTLQKPPGEVILEVEVWELNVRRAQQLGILPPQPFLLQFLNATPLSLVGAIPGLYAVTLPGASGTLTFSSSVVRSYQTLQLRASQGQPASLSVGQRFPIVTAILSSGLSSDTPASSQAATLGLFPTIQYQDIGLTLKAIPFFHAAREVTLQLELAIRGLGAREVNDLPTITQRQFTGQVRLQDGESFLLGGIRNRSDQRTRTGYPWLARLPVVGLLFSVFRKQQDETELWFVLRPHIVRAAPAEEFASASIFFGKEILGLPAVVETVPAAPPPGALPPGVAPGVPQPPGVPPAPGQPPIPGAVPQPGAAPQPGVPATPPGAPPVAPPEGAAPPTPLPQEGLIPPLVTEPVPEPTPGEEEPPR